MASASCTLFYSVTHFLFLLLITMFIHHSESCPDDNPFNFTFSCPDNVYNGPLSSSHFSSPSPKDYDCPGGPCELTCDRASHTMINCTGYYKDLAHRVIEINPTPTNPTITIAVDHPDEWLHDLCKVYFYVNSSFPLFKSVTLLLSNSSGENETFLGCSFPEGNVYWDFLTDNKTGCGDATVYGVYDYGQIPKVNLVPESCMQFLMQYSSATDHNKSKGRPREIILPFVFSAIAIIILIALIVYWRRRDNKSGLRALASRITSLNHTRPDLEEGSTNNGVTVFSYAELQEVTNNFDPERELGEGGFGVVYHGKLEDGREVAVKRMFEKNYRQIEQFKNEIQLLTNVRHPNLVTLYGSTSRHSRELLLVYEYIPNGTLAEHLHGRQSKSVLLLWPTRLKIAIQTASALCYLHYKDIIHRDIKSNNILLDKSFIAKVADFGLSRLFPSDVSHVSTAPQGTPGYLDPEYHQCYHLTDRSDVYSFGVVLIELISSMEAVDFGRERHEVNLATYAMNRIQGCQFGELVDVNLGYEKSFKVRRMTTLVAELAFRCLQHEREIRPSMEEVLEALKRIESVDYDELEDEEMG